MKFSIFKPNKEKPEPQASLFEGFQLVPLDELAGSEPIFVTGVGRSGTHFLAKLFDELKGVSAYHLDSVGNSTADSFIQYAKWYKLPVDMSGFFASRSFLIHKALKQGDTYLESNPYLSLSISDLAEYFTKSRFIITLRDPRKVVLSHYNKGWYEHYEPVIGEHGMAPAYQYQIERPNHFFGRLFPVEKEEFHEWLALTQVGKIAWMWQAIYNAIADQLLEMPKDRFEIIKIDEFDWRAFNTTKAGLSLSDSLDEVTFRQIRDERPGKSLKKAHADWGAVEEGEFQEQIAKFKGFV